MSNYVLGGEIDPFDRGEDKRRSRRERGQDLAGGTSPFTPNNGGSGQQPGNTSPPASTGPGGPGGSGGNFISDLFGLNAQTIIPYEPTMGLDYWASPPVTVYEGKGSNRRAVGMVRKWEWIWYGAPAGLEKTYGNIATDYDRLSSSTLDTRFPGFATLPLDITAATTPDPTGSLAGIHWQYIFNTLILGVGAGANVSLLKETSSSNPAIAAITYSPGAAITCLGEAIINGATNARNLVVGRAGSAAQLISDASGTVAATMHANTASLWAVQQTILTDQPILLYTDEIAKLDVTSGTGDAPTTVWDNVPRGGFGCGLLARGGGPMRWYLVFPKDDVSTGMLVFGAEKPGKVVHFDQEGLDPQEMTPADFLGIVDVHRAAIWQDGILVTDQKRVVFNNDVSKQELGMFRDREPDSDKEYRIRDFIVKGAELLIVVNQIASPNGTGNTKQWLESYDPRTNAFHQVSEAVTLSTTGVLGIGGAGGLPWSVVTQFLHWYSDGSWYRKFEAPYGINPHTYYRKTSGSQSSTGQKRNASGTLKTTRMEMKQLQGWPKVVSRITRLGDNTGDSGGTVTYTAGGVAAQFTDTTPSGVQANHSLRKDFPNNQSFFHQLQLQVDIAQSEANASPNAAPVKIEGYAFLGMQPKPPRFIDDVALGIPESPFTGRVP